jgi:FkbH-like protein
MQRFPKNTLYEKLFSINNFVSIKANWNTKPQNVQEILNETNLLPGNVLFVDDSPIEREQIKQAFPEINIISGPISTWRRTLLWASELQVPYITDESRTRTESIKSMIAREEIKSQSTMSVADYVASLQVEVKMGEISNREHKKFQRAFELLNKTNQFNSTDIRWNEFDIKNHLKHDGRIIYAEVSDRLSDYGLTAVILARRNECTQFVMSCRVWGLRVEFSMFDYFINSVLKNQDWNILYKKTDKNTPI